MKLLTLFIAIHLVGIFTKAQQPELTGNTWNLEKVSLNNVEHFFPNSISTIHATANFTANQAISVICNSLSASVTYTNSTITFIGSGLTLGSCPNLNNNEYNIFEGYYFGQFFGSNTANGIYSTYNYQIVAVSNQLRLTLTNPNGDKAIYRSGNLSVNDDIETKIFKVYPNPVKNILNISTKFEEVNIQLFDTQGKLILNKFIQRNINSKDLELDMSFLDNGIYLLTINKEFKYKLIKE